MHEQEPTVYSFMSVSMMRVAREDNARLDIPVQLWCFSLNAMNVWFFMFGDNVVRLTVWPNQPISSMNRVVCYSILEP